MTNAELLLDGDLDMVDMIAIPDRLENAVGKAQHQDVLYRFLAEIMVDPINLLLVHELLEFMVELLGRFQIGAEGLFDDEPPPRAVLRQHACAGKRFCDRQERAWRGGEIKQPIAAGLAFRLKLIEL